MGFCDCLIRVLRILMTIFGIQAYLLLIIISIAILVEQYKNTPLLFNIYLLSVLISVNLALLWTIILMNKLARSSLQSRKKAIIFSITIQITGFLLLILGIYQEITFQINISFDYIILISIWNFFIIVELMIMSYLIFICSRRSRIIRIRMRIRNILSNFSEPVPVVLPELIYLGVSDNQMALLPKRILTEEIIVGSFVEDNLCAICIESYVNQDIILDLPCSHFFHELCIKEWLIYKKICPCCRRTVVNQ